MSMMIKEAPISEQDMVAEAEKALADISAHAPASAASSSARKAWSSARWSPCSPAATRCWSACPGLAKTKLVETLGIVLGLDARRIQFTPDLMPSDILGSEVMEQDDHGRAPSASFRARSSRSC